MDEWHLGYMMSLMGPLEEPGGTSLTVRLTPVQEGYTGVDFCSSQFSDPLMNNISTKIK